MADGFTAVGDLVTLFEIFPLKGFDLAGERISFASLPFFTTFSAKQTIS